MAWEQALGDFFTYTHAHCMTGGKEIDAFHA